MISAAAGKSCPWTATQSTAQPCGPRRKRSSRSRVVEDGGFASYNKVTMPFEGRIIFAQGGADADRSDFLNKAYDAKNSLDLVTAVTPEYSYPNCNVARVDYRRTAQNGVTLLLVEVGVEEVRIVAPGTYTNSAAAQSAMSATGGGAQAPVEHAQKAPIGAKPVDGGTVSTKTYTDAPPPTAAFA